MSKQASATQRSALNLGERVILCCSSTRHRRFTDNLVAVMSLPSGSRVRLRYGDDVCDPNLRVLGYQPSPRLIGMQALIAHVGFESGSTNFLLLRMGSLVELRTVGSVTFFEVELGDFVEARVGTKFGDLLSPVATLELPAQASGEDKPSGYFCQHLTSSIDLSRGQDTGLWERVAARFLAAISNSNAAFPFIFHIGIVQKRSRKPVSLRAGTLIAPAIRQIELQIRTLSTQSSFDSIIQAPVGGTLTIGIDHPDGRLASGARHPIDTTRNLLISRLTTNISLRPAYGSLTVTARRCSPPTLDRAVPAAPIVATATVAAVAPPRAEPVNEVIVELPMAVGRPWTRLLAIGFIAAVIGVHAFDIGELLQNADYVWGKAIAVFVAAFVALFMGLKPQAGSY